MYYVLYPESNFCGFSGMVPETLHISSRDMLGQYDEDPIPVSANAKICVIRSVVLISYLRKTVKRLKKYVAFPHISSVTRSWDFRKVHVCVP